MIPVPLLPENGFQITADDIQVLAHKYMQTSEISSLIFDLKD